MKEERKDIIGYEGLYMISNMGNILSLEYKYELLSRRGRIITRNKSKKLLSPRKKTNHKNTIYLTVSLCKNKIRKNYLVHRLVAVAFCGLDINSGLEVGHIDNNPQNNMYTNLIPCTHQENEKHRIGSGHTTKGLIPSTAKLDKDKLHNIYDKYNKGYTIKELSKEYNISISSMKNVVLGKSWCLIYNDYHLKLNK